MNNSYHVIISHRQSITPRVSGAIAIDVRDFYLHSATRDRTTIYGGEQEGVFPDIPFRGIRPSRLRLCSRSTDYARQLARIIPDEPGSFVEVHNRAVVFNILGKHMPAACHCLYLHNDPAIIRGLENTARRRAVLARADVVICNSDFIRRRFLQGIEDSHDKVHVVYLGIDTSDRPAPSQAARKRIVFAGRVIREKGAMELARALARVLPRHPDWSAVYIGASRHAREGKLTGYEMDVFRVLDTLNDRVEFTGHLPNAEVERYFSASRIAVVPSICTEAFGRVAMEAMINGCAVISSERGGLAEVTDGTALPVEPEDDASIEAALEKLMSDPELLEQHRQQAFRSARERLDIRQLSRQLDDLRDEIMARRGR